VAALEKERGLSWKELPLNVTGKLPWLVRAKELEDGPPMNIMLRFVAVAASVSLRIGMEYLCDSKKTKNKKQKTKNKKQKNNTITICYLKGYLA
jgi:hypothetical protein